MARFTLLVTTIFLVIVRAAISEACRENQFRCSYDGRCIPQSYVCDSGSDCPGGDDERDCDTCNANKYRCANRKRCISQDWFCDGATNCSETLKSFYCGHQSPSDCTTSEGHFHCDNNRCIPLESACNGLTDCGDRSDENVQMCKVAQQLCSNSYCSHTCHATPGGAVCSCPPDHLLLNDRTCQNPTLKDTPLIYSTKTQIDSFDLSTNASSSPIITNLPFAIGVSLDATHVYWSDIAVERESISRSLRNGTNRETIAIAGIGIPEAIALDWITGNIYFTDSFYKGIGVCTKSGAYCTPIITDNIKRPRGLALHPINGEMYWTDWGYQPRISRSEMNGNSRSPLVTGNLGWPNGLTIDYSSSRLYWVDARRKSIESINLDGTDRKKVLPVVDTHPFSIAVFENRLFWSDWKTRSIHHCDKSTGEGEVTLIQGVQGMYGLYIDDSSNKSDVPNPCKAQPCAEICLLGVNHRYTCACSPGKVLHEDGTSCREVSALSAGQRRLIVAAGDVFIDYRHAILGKPQWTKRIESGVPFPEVYDAIDENSLRSDDQVVFDEISRIFRRYIGVVGIAFDYVGNNLYTVDLPLRRIHITSLSTLETTLIKFSEQPSSLLLVPELAMMFVAFCGASGCHVDKMSMTGSGRSPFLKDVFQGPRVSLAFEAGRKRIFWADEGTGRIESVSLDGKDRRLLHSHLEMPVSLALLGDEVFWTVRDSSAIFWSNATRTARKKRFELPIPGVGIAHLMTSGNYSRDQSPEELHKCRGSNGGCSHVCLVESAGGFVCRCPEGMTLDSDLKSCVFEAEVKGGDPGDLPCNGTSCAEPVGSVNGEDEGILDGDGGAAVTTSGPKLHAQVDW